MYTELTSGPLSMRTKMWTPSNPGSPGGSKSNPAMQETQVLSQSWEDLLVEGNGNPLQYSCLENPMDRGAWWDTVHGVAKSWTQLGN